MVFKRRKPRTYMEKAQDWVYPKGGWKRAITYTFYRLRRLPDQPHRIARGVGAGVFISFTPLFGFHFIGGAVCAWLVGGNVVAALIGTFLGNPVTTPFIAVLSLQFGRWLLGQHGAMPFHAVVKAFAQAADDLWRNMIGIFTDAPTSWAGLSLFFEHVFLPYAIGGLLPGLAAAVAAHYATLPVIAAYQKRRVKQLRKRAEKLRSGAANRLRDPAEEAGAPRAD